MKRRVKRVKRKHLVPRKVLRKVGRSLYGKDYASNRLVMYRNPKDRMFMPPRYRTCLTLNAMAQLPVGFISDYFTVKLNAINLPFNTGGHFFASAPGAPVITGLSPAGYDKLGFIYTTYRVTASKILVTVLPTSAADELVFAIAPALPGEAPLSVDQVDAVSYSRGPQYTSTYFKSGLSKFISVKQLIGNTIQGDLSALIAPYGNDPSYLLRWDIGFRTLTNAATGQTVSVAVRVKYWVDFFELRSNNIEPGD